MTPVDTVDRRRVLTLAVVGVAAALALAVVIDRRAFAALAGSADRPHAPLELVVASPADPDRAPRTLLRRDPQGRLEEVPFVASPEPPETAAPAATVLTIRGAGPSPGAPSHAVEVWIGSLEGLSSTATWPPAQLPPGWQTREDPAGREGVVIIGTRSGAELAFELDGAGSFSLLLLRHPWSGRVELQWGDRRATIDLYRAPGENGIGWQRYAAEEVFAPATTVKLTATAERSARTAAGRWTVLDANGDALPIARAAWGAVDATIDSGDNSADFPADTGPRAARWLARGWAVAGGLASLGIVLALGRRFGAGLWAIQFAAAIGIAVAMLTISYPAHLSPDSLTMWQQAQTGRYTDWHPIGMTLFLRAVFHLFPGAGPNEHAAIAAFVQGTALWMLLFSLIAALEPRPGRRAIASLAIAAFFPLWPYTITLWKDVWFLLGSAAWLVCAIRWLEARPGRFAWLLGAIVSAVALMLCRQTAWFSFAAFAGAGGVVAGVLGGRKLLVRVAVVSCASLVAGVALQTALYRALDVNRDGNFRNLYFLFEVIGTLHWAQVDDERLARLATAQEMGLDAVRDGIARYRCGGGMEYLLFGPEARFPTRRLLAGDFAQRDLPQLVREEPRAWLRHKGCTLAALLGWDGKPVHYPYHRQIDGNALGLELQPLRNDWRNRFYWEFLELQVIHRAPGRWLYRTGWWGVVAAAAVLAVVSFRQSQLQAVVWPVIWGWAALLPFFITVPVADWRYVMPSQTLFVLAALVLAFKVPDFRLKPSS